MAVIGAGLWPLTVHAETTNFTQRILPLNCVFETVNDGTGTVRYLTPTECGVIFQTYGFSPGSSVPQNTHTSRASNSPVASKKPRTNITGQTTDPQPIIDGQKPPTDSNFVIPPTNQSEVESNDQSVPPSWWHHHRTAVLVTGGVTLTTLLIILLFIFVL